LDHLISKHFCWICVDFLLAFGWVIFFCGLFSLREPNGPGLNLQLDRVRKLNVPEKDGQEWRPKAALVMDSNSPVA
jgi:hypothetical protein